MKILIVGSDSQIGIPFATSFKKFKFYKYNKKKLDITNIDNANKEIKKLQPNVIINTAAFTDVDLAEIKTNEAFKINSNGPKNLAKISADINAFLIHFSTDYVFDGRKKESYRETDKVNPISIYGKSKLEGEKNITSYNDKYFILRISWLYGLYKKNFVTQILNLLLKGKILKVIDDQFSIPTNSLDIYEILINMLCLIDKGYNKKNIFHYSGDGKIVSRYEFARIIAKSYKNLKNLKSNILPISSKSYYKKQIRPKFSALNCSKIYKELKIKPINWKYSLENTINNINKKDILS